MTVMKVNKVINDERLEYNHILYNNSNIGRMRYDLRYNINYDKETMDLINRLERRNADMIFCIIHNINYNNQQ